MLKFATAVVNSDPVHFELINSLLRYFIVRGSINASWLRYIHAGDVNWNVIKVDWFMQSLTNVLRPCNYYCIGWMTDGIDARRDQKYIAPS